MVSRDLAHDYADDAMPMTMGSTSLASARARSKGAHGRVIIVDDDPAACEVLEEALSHRGFSARSVLSAGALIRLFEAGETCDVVLTDLRMPGGSGLELARAVRRDYPAIPVVVITAFGSIETAVEAMRRGAYDFLTKPYDLDLVALTLDRAVTHRRALAELEGLRIARSLDQTEILGKSPAMERVLSTIARVADSDAALLVTGESGTGKELVARAIHGASGRSKGAFVAVNCAALPEGLFESELFGHAKGAFTDARGARAGLFARANRGTLFLDEIGDMPLATQAKLLRALQDGTIRPVGADRETSVDVRVIAATHRDLEVLVAAGQFRQDLFFRIQVIEVALPPLRARGNDVLLLAHELLRRASERAGRPTPIIGPAVAAKLLAYDWPGNVRELQNCIARISTLTEGNEVRESDLPARIRRADDGHIVLAADEPGGILSLDEIERRYVLHVMRVVKGNKKLAAEMLGLDRSTLYRKLELYGEHEPKESR
jgi:DNA-binding NtrC family response regulator